MQKENLGIFHKIFSIYLLCSNFIGMLFVTLMCAETFQTGFALDDLWIVVVMLIPSTYFIYSIITGISLLWKKKKGYILGQVLNVTDIILGIIYSIGGGWFLICGIVGDGESSYIDLTGLFIGIGVFLLIVGIFMTATHTLSFKYFKNRKHLFIA